MRDRFADLQRAVPGVDHGTDSEQFASNGFFEEMPETFSNIFDEVEVIRTTILQIQQEMAETDRLHNVILSSAQPDKDAKAALEKTTASIKSKANNVRLKLKRMEQELEQEGNHSSADVRIRKAQHASLTRTFITVMSEYNQIQNDYRDKCKDKIERQLRITGNEKTADEVEEMLENGDPAVFTQGILMETAQAKQALNEINERHNAILNLEASIRELHSMFVEMAMLIQEQGEMIDNIESNVANTEIYLHQAATKLQEARQLQKKTQCCCCLKCCPCSIL